MTALHRASQNGHFATVMVLLEFEGIDINQHDFQGNTALHYSVQSVIKKIKYDEYLQITDLLLNKGSDPTSKMKRLLPWLLN